MSTKYIILTKDPSDPCYENKNNQIFYTNKSLTYLMPSVNHSYYAENGLFEHFLIDWCKQYCSKESIFLDIGAHTGSYAITLAPYAKHVYAFEPQKMTYYALCGGVALSSIQNIDCCNYGLGNESQVGIQKLYIVSNDGGGSTIQTPSKNDTILAMETIEIKTLDSMNITDPISFIKMDVEDNELYVLEGGRDTILRNGCPHILFEQNDPSNTVVSDYLRSTFGYNIIQVGGTINMYLACK
jgi:FkbM family methyltransferase